MTHVIVSIVRTMTEGVRAARQGIVLAAVLAASLAHAGPIELKVMTRNLYFGADLTRWLWLPLRVS